jgi:hypothetical protein
MNWTNNSLFNFVKKVLKELKIPFNDPCDTSYTGDCICGSGTSSANVTNSSITGETPFTNPPISPIEGDEFLNITDGEQWIYDGVTWIQRPAGAAGGALNGVSKVGSNVVLGQAATGAGLASLTSNRFIPISTFNLTTEGTTGSIIDSLVAGTNTSTDTKTSTSQSMVVASATSASNVIIESTNVRMASGTNKMQVLPTSMDWDFTATSPLSISTPSDPVNYGSPGMAIQSNGNVLRPAWEYTQNQKLGQSLVTIANPLAPTTLELSAIEALTSPTVVPGDVITVIGNGTVTNPQYKFITVADGATVRVLRLAETSTSLPIHTTYAAALTALGAGKEFRYATANLEGVPSPNNSVQAFT